VLLQQIANSLKSLLEYKEDDIEEVFNLTFQVTYSDVFGNLLTCELKPDGEKIPVAKDNVQVHTLILSSFRTTLCCRSTLICILIGY